MPLTYKYDKAFELECGGVLPELEIAYHTYGDRSCGRIVWVCHALTANSDVADWWPGTVGPGRFLDPDTNFVVCANILGSHYGTTGPLSLDPRTGEPYYGDFPFFTLRDIARVNLLLADHLGIDRVDALMGSSIGGFQALEMELLRPGLAEKLILIATSAKASPWAVAFNETQRMSIEADCTFGQRSPDAGSQGMGAARAAALLSYRGPSAYNATQRDESGEAISSGYRACTYQQHQGEKLRRRFNAYSYYHITQAFDTHDAGRGRSSLTSALGTIRAETLVIGITSDLIFPLGEQRFLADNIPGARLEVIDSDFGHDGFLIENDKLNYILKPFIDNQNNRITDEITPNS